MKTRSFFHRPRHRSVSHLAAFILVALVEGVSVTPALTQIVGEVQQDRRNLIINNSGESEVMYARSSNTQLFVSSKGKVYFDQEGKITFGTGNHRLKNVDGQGSNIWITPSLLDAVTMSKAWVLGFRADEMKFQWIFDEPHTGETEIVVDSLTAHNNKVVSGGVYRTGDTAAKFTERTVGAERISLIENRIVLKGISNLTYVAGRSYIKEDTGPAKTLPETESSASERGSCERKLVIGEDGIVALQDIMVHLTHPLEGEAETLLRNVTLVNQYRDQLMFLEIRGNAGKPTAIVFFDKGQSVCIDKRGNPVSGKGKFEIRPAQGGQLIGGWLKGTRLSGRGKLLSESATFEFIPRNLLARWGTSAVEFIETNLGGRWKTWTAAGGALLVALAIIFWRYRQKKPAAE